MNLESTLGKMGACMRASTEKIKNTAMVFILGLIRNATLAGGLMENNMGLGSLSLKKARRN